MTASLQVGLANFSSKLPSASTPRALSAWSSWLVLLFIELTLKMSSILLTLISLRAVTLCEFRVAPIILHYLTYVSSWVSRMNSHLRLSCWLKHLVLCIVTKYSTPTLHLNKSLILIPVTFVRTLPSSCDWFSTLSLIKSSCKLTSIAC